MKYVDEFRAPALIKQASEEIRRLVDPGRRYRIMEVCGGHTHAIYRFALADLLPPNIELIHGPGCPVCVLPMGRIDDGLSMVERPDVIFTAFGDMMRVPGAQGSPLEHKALLCLWRPSPAPSRWRRCLTGSRCSSILSLQSSGAIPGPPALQNAL